MTWRTEPPVVIDRECPQMIQAGAFLELYPPGSDPRGEARREANAIKDDLDDYNNSCFLGD